MRSKADTLTRLHRLSEHLYVFEDTCLVYLITEGERGILIDCGSGDILDALPSAGITRVEHVLHTHHHRDQCAGDHRLVQHGASLSVPEREAHLFAAVEQFWDTRASSHRYELSSDWFTLASSVPVTSVLRDYESFRWARYTFRILPAPGHTKGSIVLLAEVDGQTIAWTGDLIAPAHQVTSAAALQWAYGGGVGILDGVQPAALALSELQVARPDRILPSHGQVIDRPEDTISGLLVAFRRLIRFQEANANDVGLGFRPVGLVSDRNLIQLTDHLWMNPYSFAHSYYLVSQSGNVLVMDYGYPSYHHFTAGFRFVEHSVAELMTRGRARQIDVVIPSHYHDDHVAGIPYLRERFGARVWAPEVMIDVLERPDTYRLPCLMPTPIPVERVLRDGQSFQWEEFECTSIHLPGHTYYHAALCFEVDGLRVALTGDTIHAGSVGPVLGGPIFQNRFNPGDFVASIDRLTAWGPQLVLTGHTGAAEVDDAWLGVARTRARAADLRFESLCPPEGLDPFWIGLHPYEHTVAPGERFSLDLDARNRCTDATLVVHMVAPDGWVVDPPEVELRFPAQASARATFEVRAPSDWEGLHTVVLCGDVTIRDVDGARALGQVCEALVRPNTMPPPSVLSGQTVEELLGEEGQTTARFESGSA